MRIPLYIETHGKGRCSRSCPFLTYRDANRATSQAKCTLFSQNLAEGADCPHRCEACKDYQTKFRNLRESKMFIPSNGNWQEEP